jgi:thiol-disulfide isomerase/thioredoxin
MDSASGEHKMYTAGFIPEADKLIAEKKPFIVIFKGGVDESGNSWCSDCVAAEPMVNQVLIPEAKKLGFPMYIVDVGLRPEWKDPQNPLRHHQVLKVNCVPTLLRIENGAVINRLKEEEIMQQDLLLAFLE